MFFWSKKFHARAFKEHTYHPYIHTYNIYPILRVLSVSLARLARPLIISERDTYRGNTIENRGFLLASETVLGVDNAKSGICYMYICMWDGTHAL